MLAIEIRAHELARVAEARLVHGLAWRPLEDDRGEWDHIDNATEVAGGLLRATMKPGSKGGRWGGRCMPL